MAGSLDRRDPLELRVFLLPPLGVFAAAAGAVFAMRLPRAATDVADGDDPAVISRQPPFVTDEV